MKRIHRCFFSYPSFTFFLFLLFFFAFENVPCFDNRPLFYEATVLFFLFFVYLPILTIRIPSSSRNLRATDTFSSFCDRKFGFLLCFGSLFWASTSMRQTRPRPSERSHSKSAMCLFTDFRCSFAHLVNVFCCILFHCASSANSRSIISSSSPWEFSLVTAISFSFILSAGVRTLGCRYRESLLPARATPPLLLPTRGGGRPRVLDGAPVAYQRLSAYSTRRNYERITRCPFLFIPFLLPSTLSLRSQEREANPRVPLRTSALWSVRRDCLLIVLSILSYRRLVRQRRSATSVLSRGRRSYPDTGKSAIICKKIFFDQL